MKRIIALLLAALTLLSIAGCTGDDPADTGTAEVTETTAPDTVADPLADNLPDVTFDGEDIHIWVDGTYGYYDLTEDEFVAGDLIDEAVVSRNNTVAGRFDVTLTYNREPNRSWRDQVKFRQSIQSGDEYDIVEGVTSYSCPLAIYGCYIDLAENAYLDLSRPWWQKEILNTLYVGERLYCVSGFFDFATVVRSSVFYFNANMVEDYALGNLYDLVEQDEWTFDKMMEFSEKVADDVNQDGVYDNQDIYGTAGRYDYWTFQPCTAGYQWVSPNDEGGMELTGLTDLLLTVHEKVYPLITTSNLHWSTYTWGKHNGFSWTRENEMLDMFANDRILFILADLSVLEVDKMREFGAYGLLPSPKYDETQTFYGTSTTAFISAIPVTTGDYDTSSIILEALQVESYKQLRSVYYDDCLSYKYVNDPQAKEMIDLMFSHLTTEFTYNYGAFSGTAVPAGMDGIGALPMACARQANLASYIQSLQVAHNASLAELIDTLDALPEYFPG